MPPMLIAVLGALAQVADARSRRPERRVARFYGAGLSCFSTFGYLLLSRRRENGRDNGKSRIARQAARTLTPMLQGGAPPTRASFGGHVFRKRSNAAYAYTHR